MKKGLLVAAVAALTFALAAPVTVLADDGDATATPSPTVKAQIVITEDNTGEVKVGMTAAEVNTKWGTNFDANLVVVWTGDAHLVVTPADATFTGTVTQTFNASEHGGTVMAHQGKTGVKSGASIDLSSSDLSPVIYLAPASKVPNTGDSNNNILWIGALVVALVCGGAAFAMRKTNA